MANPFDVDARRAIRMAIALDCYENDKVRIVDPEISGHEWLVATHKGLFAVGHGLAKLLLHGWFFGICRHGDELFLFENCSLRDHSRTNGRIVRLQLMDGRLVNPAVLAKHLDANCHQLKVIDERLCLVDTANQAILRFTLYGGAVDTKTPFAIAPATDRSGAYLHINSIAQIGEKIAILLHNGKAIPEKCSELAWLDSGWNIVERVPLEGHCCHDILEDEYGVLWHSASMTGEIMTSEGRRVKVDAHRMTRGLAISATSLCVGVSGFGPRQNRDALPGAVVVFDRSLSRLSEIELGGPPADIIAI